MNANQQVRGVVNSNESGTTSMSYLQSGCYGHAMEPTAESDVLCDDPLVGHVWKPLKVERTKTGYETTQVCARCRASRLLDEQGQEISVTPPELCGCPAWMAPKHLPSCKTRVTSPGHGVEDVDAFLTAYDNQPGIETTVLPPEGGKA